MRLVLMIFLWLPGLVWADDKTVRLYAAPELVESGLIQHIRPRFSLKTQIKVDMVSEAEADLSLAAHGIALFSGLGRTWHMDLRARTPGSARFADWLTSDVGANTIQSYAPDGAPLFGAPEVVETAQTVEVYPGDPVLGRAVSDTHCGRCHRVHVDGRMGLASTPSFMVLRGFDDWEGRFAGFFVLKPHGAFTQVEGITEPFPLDRPSPIQPIRMTLDDLEAVLAFVASLSPADLGAPLAHQ